MQSEKAMAPQLQYSCLENPMDRGAWWAAVHGVAKSRTWLSNFTFTFHFHPLEKAMATHSSVLAWRIPGTGEPGGLLSMGSHRVGHDWSDLAAACLKIISIMIRIQSEIMHSTKKQGNNNFNGTRQSTEANYEINWMLESTNRILKQW